MMTRVKTAQEIVAMRESGKMLATVLDVLKSKLEPGMSTKDLGEIARGELAALGGKPAFLGYFGYPDVLCVSVNDEVVHGIPKPDKIIASGDIVSMDFGVLYQDMITDSAISVIAGTPRNSSEDTLVDQTAAALLAGIQEVRHNAQVGDIAAGVQSVLDRGGFGIVRDLVGHGVGHDLHEDPNIPNYGRRGTGVQLKAGMTIAIEPMATLGGYPVTVDADGWTVRTQDGSMAAHFEHTVLVTENCYEILTQL